MELPFVVGAYVLHEKEKTTTPWIVVKVMPMTATIIRDDGKKTKAMCKRNVLKVVFAPTAESAAWAKVKADELRNEAAAAAAAKKAQRPAISGPTLNLASLDPHHTPTNPTHADVLASLKNVVNAKQSASQQRAAPAGVSAVMEDGRTQGPGFYEGNRAGMACLHPSPSARCRHELSMVYGE